MMRTKMQDEMTPATGGAGGQGLAGHRIPGIVILLVFIAFYLIFH